MADPIIIGIFIVMMVTRTIIIRWIVTRSVGISVTKITTLFYILISVVPVRGLPFLISYFLFHGPRVRTLLTRTREFPQTRCTGPCYLRPLHTEISIHGSVLHLNLFLRGPALYQNFLHMDPPVRTLLTRTRGFMRTLSTGPGYLRVIFGFLSRETIEFPGHGFPGMDIIPQIGLLLGSVPTD